MPSSTNHTGHTKTGQHPTRTWIGFPHCLRITNNFICTRPTTVTFTNGRTNSWKTKKEKTRNLREPKNANWRRSNCKRSTIRKWRWSENGFKRSEKIWSRSSKKSNIRSRRRRKKDRKSWATSLKFIKKFSSIIRKRKAVRTQITKGSKTKKERKGSPSLKRWNKSLRVENRRL